MNNHCFKIDRILSILFCTAAFFFFSCEKEKTKFTIDQELEPYLNLFLEEGKKRGRFVDIEKEGGLILEFADLTPPVIGLCYSSIPIRVQIDKTYWQKTTESLNRENLREEVVFHELGHGFLKRGHKNTVLENDEWASMMCGEPQINGRSWFLNFNGFRKEYYLDELFNSNTPIPEWSKPAVFDGNKGDFILDKVETDVILPNSFDTNLLRPLYSTMATISSDFYVEIDFVLVNGEFSGIFAGNDRLDTYNYFTVSTDNRSLVMNNKCAIPFAEVMTGDKYQQGGAYNKLAISKRGDMLFFYINDKLVYQNDYQIPSYNTFGIIIPTRGSVSIKSLEVYADENVVLRSAKQAGSPVILGEVAIPEIFIK